MPEPKIPKEVLDREKEQTARSEEKLEDIKEPLEKKIAGDGTKLSGFVSFEENQPPRECGNCIFYKHDLCHHPIVMIDPCVLGTHGKPKPVEDEDCCNFFQSPTRTVMYVVRHGEDENDDLIGGWEDAPIDEKGLADAKQAAKFLSGRSIRCIVCSDMKRTHETAKIIAKELGITEIVTDVRLRTWNKGIYNGEEKTEQNEADLGWYKDNPHAQVPEGESHDAFEDRCDEAFEYYIDKARNDGMKILVTHNSGIKQLQRYCELQAKGDESKITSENGAVDSVLPGGIAKVTETHGKLKCEVVLKDRKRR